jgi:hypothetical protein
MSTPLTSWGEEYKDAQVTATELVGERAKHPPGEDDGQRR